MPVVSALEKIKDFMMVGGPVVWILLSCSVIALTIVLIKVWQIKAGRIENRVNLDASITAWRNHNPQQAISMLSPSHPIENIAIYTMNALENSSPEMPVSLIREETERLALNTLHKLRSKLRPLEIIASLSPLLGLLGTVLGMIVAFQQMESAGNQVDPSVLSGGIWQALLTTAVGISVAVPAVALHAWLERKVERISHIMNDTLTQVFTAKDIGLTRD